MNHQFDLKKWQLLPKYLSFSEPQIHLIGYELPVNMYSLYERKSFFHISVPLTDQTVSGGKTRLLANVVQLHV